ncbi:MAG: hypothetical protein RLZ18_1280, partial [Actinomycetota bacterium]
CADLWGVTDDEVARVVNGGGGKFDLSPWLGWLRRVGEFVEASGVEDDVVDGEAGFIALNEVDRHLGLLHHLVAGARCHALDDHGNALRLTARGARGEAPHDEHDADGHACTDDEGLLVNSAFHKPILA